MSSVVRRSLRGALCAGLALSIAPRLSAQSTAEYRARFAALSRAWSHVHAARAAEDSVRNRVLPRDTIRSGSLILVTNAADTAFARPAIESAARALEREFGAPTARLRSRALVLSRHGGPRGDSIADLAELDERGKRVAESSTFATREAMTEAWIYSGARALMRDLGPEFAKWIGVGLPIDSATASTWTGVRVDLVTSPAASAHKCFAGDAAECALALGLTGADDPATRWYELAERRELVIRHDYNQLRQGRESQFTRCVQLAEAGVCDSLARLIPPERIPPRLEFDARQSAVRVTLALGGAAAFERMLAAPHRVEDQLRAASGVSTDSLMRAWHAQIVAVSPGTTTMNPRTAMIAIFWTCVCGAMALGSSRWR